MNGGFKGLQEEHPNSWLTSVRTRCSSAPSHTSSPELLLLMAENSDYENRKEKEDVQSSFVTISYFVLWPIYLLLIFMVGGFVEVLPTWAFVVFFLFSPLALALFLNRWNSRLEEK